MKTVGIFRCRADIDALAERLNSNGARLTIGKTGMICHLSEYRGGEADITAMEMLREEVAGYLYHKSSKGVMPRIPNRLDGSGPFELSAAQREWTPFADQPLQEQWLPIVFRLQGPLDTAAFQKAFAAQLNRHEALRSVFLNLEGVLKQRVAEPTFLTVVDLPEMTVERAYMEVWNRLKKIHAMPLGLEEPTLRLALYLAGAGEALLAGFVHHTVWDAKSQKFFFDDLMVAYFNETLGATSPEKIRRTYRDYVAWEQSCSGQLSADANTCYWKYMLFGAEAMNFAAGQPGDQKSFGVLPFAVKGRFLEEIGEFCKAHGTTIPLLTIGALSIVLGRLCSRSDCLMGHVVDVRPTGFENVVGNFVQLRPLHLRFDDNPTFADLLTRLRLAWASSSSLRNSAPPVVRATSKFDNVLVNFTDVRPERAGKAGRPWYSSASRKEAGKDEVKPAAAGVVKVPLAAMRLNVGMTRLPRPLQTVVSRDLHFSFVRSELTLAGNITFARRSFDAQRARQLIENLMRVLRSAVQKPGQAVRDIA